MKKVKMNNGEVRIVTSRHGNMLIADKLAIPFEEKEEKQVIETKEEKRGRRTKKN